LKYLTKYCNSPGNLTKYLIFIFDFVNNVVLFIFFCKKLSILIFTNKYKNVIMTIIFKLIFYIFNNNKLLSKLIKKF